MKADEYTSRFYRSWQKPADLQSFRIMHGETDLQIFAPKDLRRLASDLVLKHRAELEKTIRDVPSFLTSLKPVSFRSEFEIINVMIQNAVCAGVGPMAGVAGAIAEFVGRGLLKHTRETIVENGGDIFIKTGRDRTLLVYAGEDSPFRDKIKIRLRGNSREFGVCTSSKKVGHSKSFGNTDAVVVIADSAVTADVFATAIGNMVKTEEDINGALDFVKNNFDVRGGLIIIGCKLGVWGEIELLN